MISDPHKSATWWPQKRKCPSRQAVIANLHHAHIEEIATWDQLVLQSSKPSPWSRICYTIKQRIRARVCRLLKQLTKGNFNCLVLQLTGIVSYNSSTLPSYHRRRTCLTGDCIVMSIDLIFWSQSPVSFSVIVWYNRVQAVVRFGSSSSRLSCRGRRPHACAGPGRVGASTFSLHYHLPLGFADHIRYQYY